MGLFNFGSSTERDAPQAIEVSDEIVAEITDKSDGYGPIVRIVPYEGEGGITTARHFFRGVHRVKRGGRKRNTNETLPWSFEIVHWGDDREIRFRYAAPDRETRSKVFRQLDSTYHDSDVTLEKEPFCDIKPGDHVATAELRLQKDEPLLPINHAKLNPEDFEIDPYDAVTSEMAGDRTGADATVIVQIVLRPAMSDQDDGKRAWWHGAGKTAKRYEQPDRSFRWGSILDGLAGDFDPETENEGYVSNADREAASVIANQRNELGYHTNVRVIAISSDRATALERVQATTEKYGNFYNSSHGQGFTADFSQNPIELLRLSVARDWVDREMPMSIDALTGLAHPPTSLSTPEVTYTHQQSDRGVPPSSPAFEDFDETGYYDDGDFDERTAVGRTTDDLFDEHVPLDSDSTRNTETSE